MRNTVFHEPELTGSLSAAWEQLHVNFIVPFLYLSFYTCVAMSLMLFIERLYMTAVILYVKMLGKKRSAQYEVDVVLEDMERNGTHPRVLVQIPMYNEREVYKLSIGAVCGLSWPQEKIVVQVLDDSTDKTIKKNVMAECKKYQDQGLNIKYENRANRNGYKAGALREGLQKQYVNECEYVVIFDADFQPEFDFLKKTITYLVANENLGMVQARWKFVNADECLMTRLQEMSLNYHFSVEQEVGSTTCQFFGFNGTAGVWRIRAIRDAGGWKERTTVEDMDLAVRASLQGWKFVFVGDVSVKNELPSTFKAYRFQQHRWSCGPANLFKKMTREIMLCPRVSIWKKIHLVYGFFFVRKIIAHWVTFIFYCVVIPACVLVPEVTFPKALAIYIPATITLLNTGGTPRSLHLLVFWILFENVMSLHRTKAAIIGLLEASRVNEWIVTEKLGNTNNQINKSKVWFFRSRFRCGERIHKLELVMGIFMFYCALYNMSYCNDHMFIYLFLQSGAFFTIAFGFVGTFV
ncbi:glucomannan 4-beta-mannosyltransferase 1-like isoform X1 [Apium graveolens]|uniref:glucomannan 4-beta-mannosyltransferase 1-like isoform X1 n=1 Tax=Apium graveolens TaxID=4045 RepID=UPI003D7BDCCA